MSFRRLSRLRESSLGLLLLCLRFHGPGADLLAHQ